MSEETYVGSKEGASKHWNGETIPLSVLIRERDPRIVTSRNHLDSETEDFIELFKEKNVSEAGSSSKFCLKAEGNAEVYPRFGRTMEWHTAAGQAVLEAAGGLVLEANTYKQFTYAKPGFENPGFTAIPSKEIIRNIF